MRHRVLAVAPAAYQAGINKDALAFDPEGGDQTCTVGLNASGKPADPPTHYWFSASVSDPTFKAMVSLVSAKYPLAHLEEWDMDKDPHRPDALLLELGLKRIEAP